MSSKKKKTDKALLYGSNHLNDAQNNHKELREINTLSDIKMPNINLTSHTTTHKQSYINNHNIPLIESNAHSNINNINNIHNSQIHGNNRNSSKQPKQAKITNSKQEAHLNSNNLVITNNQAYATNYNSNNQISQLPSTSKHTDYNGFDFKINNLNSNTNYNYNINSNNKVPMSTKNKPVRVINKIPNIINKPDNNYLSNSNINSANYSSNNLNFNYNNINNEANTTNSNFQVKMNKFNQHINNLKSKSPSKTETTSMVYNNVSNNNNNKPNVIGKKIYSDSSSFRGNVTTNALNHHYHTNNEHNLNNILTSNISNSKYLLDSNNPKTPGNMTFHNSINKDLVMNDLNNKNKIYDRKMNRPPTEKLEDYSKKLDKLVLGDYNNKNKPISSNFPNRSLSNQQKGVHSNLAKINNNNSHTSTNYKKNVDSDYNTNDHKIIYDSSVHKDITDYNKDNNVHNVNINDKENTYIDKEADNNNLYKNNINNSKGDILESTDKSNINNNESNSNINSITKTKINPKSIYNPKLNIPATTTNKENQTHNNFSSNIKQTSLLNNTNINSNATTRAPRAFGLGTNFNYASKQRSSSVKTESIDIMSLINSNHPPLNLNILNTTYSNYESSKYSFKKCQSISAYAANTHQGCVRNYNEDRVSIILNISKPASFKNGYWPKCSFFAVYDGHGGAGCADYLRDNLHQHIIKDSFFPHSVKDAILSGCKNAEDEFTHKYGLSSNGDIVDRSGSCAVFVMFVDDMCYVGNVGDSRAIMSKYGNEIKQLTRDHKPSDDIESKRIYSLGGKVYQTQTSASSFGFNSGFLFGSNTNNSNFTSKFGISSNQMLSGPSRVFPGRLSVSRTFGDIEAKLPKFGGIPGVLSAVPDVISFKVTDECDFLILGCDGIYDLYKNEELVDAVNMCLPSSENISNFSKLTSKEITIHSLCGKVVDMIMKTAISRNSIDNITSVLIAFNGFENKLKSIQDKINNTTNNDNSNINTNIASNNIASNNDANKAKESSSTNINNNAYTFDSNITSAKINLNSNKELPKTTSAKSIKYQNKLSDSNLLNYNSVNSYLHNRSPSSHTKHNSKSSLYKENNNLFHSNTDFSLSNLNNNMKKDDFYSNFNNNTTSNFFNKEEINNKFVKQEKNIRNKEKTLNSLVPLINDNKFRQTHIDKAYKSIYSGNNSNFSLQNDKISTKSPVYTSTNFSYSNKINKI